MYILEVFYIHDPHKNIRIKRAANNTLKRSKGLGIPGDLQGSQEGREDVWKTKIACYVEKLLR